MIFLVSILQIVGALGVFLYGLKAMSEGLQKAAGGRLRTGLRRATSNPLVAAMSGLALTGIIQSSSATTVMVVAVCSAGLMSLGESLAVIFGANVGTTTTGWVVSWIGFRVKLALVAAPLVGVGFFAQYFDQGKGLRRFGHVLIGLGFLLLGLDLLRQAMPSIEDAPALQGWMLQLDPTSFSGLALCVLFGTALTAVLQSSSASFAVTLTAAAKGYIDFPTCAAIALGQNIGTTATAALAAISASLDARRAALGHILFNVLGAVWMGLLLLPALRLVDAMIPGDPFSAVASVAVVAIPTHTAAFHTLFNVSNAAIFLLARGPFEQLLGRLLPERSDDRAGHHELVYLATPFGETPDLLLSAARREIHHMAGFLVEMVQTLRASLVSEAPEAAAMLEQMVKWQTATASLETKISDYLADVIHGQLSAQASREALGLLSVVHGLARIAGHGQKVARLAGRLEEENLHLSEMARVELIQAADALEANLREMRLAIVEPRDDTLAEVARREQELNSLRDRFRQSHLERLREGSCRPQVGLIFADMLSSFEKMGDHAYNVAVTCASDR